MAAYEVWSTADPVQNGDVQIVGPLLTENERRIRGVLSEKKPYTLVRTFGFDGSDTCGMPNKWGPKIAVDERNSHAGAHVRAFMEALALKKKLLGQNTPASSGAGQSFKLGRLWSWIPGLRR